RRPERHLPLRAVRRPGRVQGARGLGALQEVRGRRALPAPRSGRPRRVRDVRAVVGSHRRVRLLAGLFFAALALRPQVVGIAPLLPAIRDDLGLSHAVAGLLGTIPVLCMGLFALPAPGFARRLGSRRAVFLAVASIGAFGVVRAVVPGPVALIALTVPVAVGLGLG